MKRAIVLFAILAMIMGMSAGTYAQTQKIGYIDFNGLIQVMPGIDSVKTKLQAYQQTLSEQMDQMRTEFENKYLDYQSQAATMSDLIKQTKEKELSDLQARIDGFQQKAQTDLQSKQEELLKPIIDKARGAVKDVAKENKYSYVINSIEDVVLYSEPTDDLMGLVKKKLGITP
jgi:outer membrane protein